MWVITFPLANGRRDMVLRAWGRKSEAVNWITASGGDSRDADWQRLRRAGYRCVKVRVTEI